MRIFNANGEKLYQEWVLRFCAKETKGQGPVPFNLLSDPATSVDLGTDTPDPHIMRLFSRATTAIRVGGKSYDFLSDLIESGHIISAQRYAWYSPCERESRT